MVITSLVLVGIGMSAKLVSSFVSARNETIERRHFPDNPITYGMISAMFFSSGSIGLISMI